MSRILSNMNVNCTWSNHWHHHNARSLPRHCTLNNRLAIEIGQCSTIPISSNNRLWHFFSYNVVESEAHIMLECPLYNPIRDKFQSLFEKIVLGNLEYLFQSEQVDISLYLTKTTALHHSRKLASLTPPLCIFSLLTSRTSKMNFSSLSVNSLVICEAIQQRLVL